MNDQNPNTPPAGTANIDAIIQAAYAQEGGAAPVAAPATPDFMPAPVPVAPTTTAPTPTALPVAVPAPAAPTLAAPTVAAPATPALAAPTVATPAPAPTMTLTQAAEIVPANATPAQIAQLAQMAGTDAGTLNQFVAMRSAYTAEGKTPVATAAVTPTPSPVPQAQTADPVAAQVAVATLYQSIGGQANWEGFANYMTQAADPATLAAYQSASPQDAVRIASVYVEGYKANPQRRDVTQANPVGGAVQSQPAATQASIQAMFADPRYASDPTFRAQAQAAFVGSL